MGASPVSAGGLGSGYADFFATVVDSVIQRDKDIFAKPLERKELETNSLISSYGTLKGALSEFQQAVYAVMDSSVFSSKLAVSSDTTKLTAFADSSVENGQHTIEILQIAKPQIARTSGYTTADVTSVGAGSLAFSSADGGAFSVSFSAGDDNLQHIAGLINSNLENTFVRASVQKIDDPDNVGDFLYQLVLSAKNTGTDNAFSVIATEDPPGSGLDDWNTLAVTAAQNAQIVLDGGTLTQSSNTVSEAINGLSMTLLPPADESTLPYTVTLDITSHTASSVSAVDKFIASYNKFSSTLADLSRVAPPSSSIGEQDGSGPLSRAILVSQMKIALRDFDLVKKMGDLGIGFAPGGNVDMPQLQKTTGANGSFVLDQLMKTDIALVAQAFSNTADGIGVRFNAIIQVGIRGSDTVVQEDLNPRLKRIKEEQEKLNEKLTRLQDRLRNQFIKLDMRLTEMNAVKQSLTNWTKGLNKEK